MRPSDLPIWQSLTKHAAAIAPLHLRDLFATARTPYDNFHLSHGALQLDIGKQRITTESLHLLRALAKAVDVMGFAKRMADGEPINHTENRAVRHMVLRAGENASEEIKLTLAKMRVFCESVHSGKWRGFSGDHLTDVVNIGIGGADLGARMAVSALAAYQQPDLRVHFVSNIDGADLATTLSGLSQRSTLFIINSKTFSTEETLQNANTARDWLFSVGGEKMRHHHLVAATANSAAAIAWGISPDHVFSFADDVGGRFSLWSAVGLPIMLAVGARNFQQLLAGAADMDQHFLESLPEKNLPLTLALLTVWNRNFLHIDSHAIFPYSQSLSLFPHHLQQLEMESNGKTVDREGEPLQLKSSPILWGSAGTNGQHSYFQLLHQGGQSVAADFIALQKADFPLPGHHQKLLAHCLAQSCALAFGQTREEASARGESENLLPYQIFAGNQPSSTLILPELSPFSLGQLIALYEHKVFCLGAIWHINAFDQFGVELGKRLASDLVPFLSGGALPDKLDVSTKHLVYALRGN